eukprot:3941976-Rhodomonas_salina.2
MVKESACVCEAGQQGLTARVQAEGVRKETTSASLSDEDHVARFSLPLFCFLRCCVGEENTAVASSGVASKPFFSQGRPQREANRAT